ncbi:tRNA-binding protein [Candidatus Pacearchaeota archaeon]|nr:tRNA-binding protein [Candidatus Pacearchaeota archaeon]
MAEYNDFEKLDIRTEKIVGIEDFPEAKKPAYKLKIDLGEFGIKNSSVQIVKNYNKKELIGKLVLCVVNFPPKQIGNFASDVLTLGVPDKNNNCVLIKPDKEVPVGGRLY